jgi:hypothetical protein
MSVLYTAPENSLSSVCQSALASSSLLPAFRDPRLLLMEKQCDPGIIPPSRTAGTSQGSVLGGPLATFGTPSTDC